MTAQTAPPTLSVNLTIEPQIMVLCSTQPEVVVEDNLPYHPPLNWEQQPTISLTVTSHATQPLTIFTWPTIFNIKLSQRRGNFTCYDLTGNFSMSLQSTKGPRRPPFSFTKGEGDDEYFYTLEPGVPTTFKSHLGVAYSAGGGLQRGHCYRFGVSEGGRVTWWRYGTKDEVMAPPGKMTNLVEERETAIPIHVDPVEFEVK